MHLINDKSHFSASCECFCSATLYVVMYLIVAYTILVLTM